MLVHAYGLFWRRDDVPWNPGSGPSSQDAVNPFSILGRVGEISPKLRVINVRPMHGVYVLHNTYGPHYVGLAKGEGGLGSRLKAHTADKHKNHWQSFSWFAFDKVLRHVEPTGLTRTKRMPLTKAVKPNQLIEDVEALLIMLLGTKQHGNANFPAMNTADKWDQVRFEDWNKYLDRAKK